ncbi:MAG: GlsB/YeaQ/YmgE family stress response membrane protein [Thermoguttaceae bacterium]
MPDFNLTPSAQVWVNVVLIWIGFATVVGLIVRSLLPGKEPSGLIGTLLIGLIGSCTGPLIVTLIWKIENFNPIGPIGMCSSVVCAAICLLLFRILFHFFKKRAKA